MIQLVFATSSGVSAKPYLVSLSNAIETFPAGKDGADREMRSSQTLRYQTHRYECCRLTAVLMMRVVKLGKSWFDAASGTSYMGQIVFSLGNSNLGDFWGEQVGLLLWVSLIAHAVMHRTEDRPFISAIIHRLFSEICCSDHPHIGVNSSKDLAEFLEKCISGQLGNVSP
jgi:hypothetical protein